MSEIKGLAIDRWREREFRTTHTPPVLDIETCTGCGLCETSCVYDAIHVIDGKAALTEQGCFGCGLCVTRCPVRALSIT